jgi:hypothetical protein
MMEVDHTGRLTDVLAIGYTRREFADSAVYAVRQWRFTPGRIAGQPVGSTITLRVQFETAGVLAYVKPVGFADTQDPLGGNLEYRPVSTTALDRLPVPLARASPVYPKEWIVEKSFPTAGNRPHGIGWEGKYLWVADSNLNAFFKHDPDTGEMVEKIQLRDTDPLPHGMTIWQGWMWYCDDVGVVCRLKIS